MKDTIKASLIYCHLLTARENVQKVGLIALEA